jgi:histidine triad (HIT) family protein
MADCLFCRIVAGEIPADIVAENERAIAFRDINPVAPKHTLAIPRQHADNLAEVAATSPETLTDVINLAAEVAAADGMADSYRLVANTGADAHQTVFHAHVHVLGGRSMGWPPG